MMLTPNSIASTRFAYYDSSHTAESLKLYDLDPSDPKSPLGRTLYQINALKL